MCLLYPYRSLLHTSYHKGIYVNHILNHKDYQRAKDIIGYLIDDVIEFEMKHSKDFEILQEVVKRVRGNTDELTKTRLLSGDIVGEA